MSGKQTCKRNICKRNKFNHNCKNDEHCGWNEEDGFKGKNYGFKGEHCGWDEEDGFKGKNYGFKGEHCGWNEEDGFKGKNYGFKGEHCGWNEEDGLKGKNYGFKGEKYGWNNEEYGFKGENFEDGFKGENYGWNEYGWNNESCFDHKNRPFYGGKKHHEEEYKANCNNLNGAKRREHDKAIDEKNAISKHYKNDTDAHKLDKEFEDKHRRRNSKESKELDNVCNRDHSRKNKKYLVDKLYIYEHHRVIDLDCCENDRRHNEAHKDFKDLETAIEDFKEADVSIKDFSDENRKDLEAYEVARAKTRDLQAQKKLADSSYVWSD